MANQLKKRDFFYSLAILVFGSMGVVQAAEIRLRSSANVDSSIVRLGDVAEVTAPFAQDAQQLAELQLFPAPIAKQSRYVRSRQIIDLLVRRGVDFSIHSVSGADVTKITRAEATAANQVGTASRPTTLRGSDRRAAQQRLQEVVLQHLRDEVGERLAPEQVAGLDIDFDSTDDLSRAVLAADNVRVSSGQDSGTAGSRNLLVHAGETTLPLQVDVTVPHGVVVAARPLTRGSVIRAIDLRLEYDANHGASRAAYQEIDLLVGKQLTTAINTGRVIAKQSVREPIVVERGNVVTVIVKVGGIKVRTDGKAMADASRGEVVAIEALDNRDRTFFARATGELDSQTGMPVVEVYGGATSAAN